MNSSVLARQRCQYWEYKNILPADKVHEAPQKGCKLSVAEWVAGQLKRTIASGEIAPGDRLPGERQLSDAMNVSRVSVRTALQQLKTQGLVSSVHGGGTRVIAQAPQMDEPLASLVLEGIENLNDLIELRTVVIQWAATRAITNHTQQDIDMLADILARMNGAVRPSEINTLDLKFYAILCRASGSAVFLHLASVLDDVLTTALFERETQLSVDHDDAAIFIKSANQCLVALKGQDAPALNQALAQNAQRRIALMLPEKHAPVDIYRQAAE